MLFRGERLKQAREQQGLTQRALAALTGLNEVQLSRYENGRIEPSVKYLHVLAEHLRVSADFLIGLTDDTKKRFGDTEIQADEQEMLETYRSQGWPGVIHLGVDRLSNFSRTK